MPQSSAVPITFAGFPTYDNTDAPAAQIAIIGVPYLSPYPVEKGYDSLNAPAAIRQASLTYQKLDHFTAVNFIEHDSSSLHNQANPGKGGDIFDGVAVNDKQVGLFAGLNRTDLAFQSQHPGRDCSCGSDGLHGGHATRHHRLQLLPQAAKAGVRQTGVIAGHNVYAGI